MRRLGMRDSHREFPVPWTKTAGQADEDKLRPHRKAAENPRRNFENGYIFCPKKEKLKHFLFSTRSWKNLARRRCKLDNISGGVIRGFQGSINIGIQKYSNYCDQDVGAHSYSLKEANGRIQPRLQRPLTWPRAKQARQT